MKRITNEQREAIVRKAVAERDALAAPASPQGVAEPVGYVNMRTRAACGDGITWVKWALPHDTPLYTSPPSATLRRALEALEYSRRWVDAPYGTAKVDAAISLLRADETGKQGGADA